MDTITQKAYGKLNLALDTIGKREDGYHLVRMIMQTVDLYDTLTITKKNTPGICLTTNRPDLPTNEDNLIYKAAQLLLKEFEITTGVTIHLEKRIPVAAGMAGGSADCAATLSGINQLFQLHLSADELSKRAVTLGADVPYCLLGGTALSEGIGDILTPLNAVPDCHVLLVKPNIDISTKWVYTTLNWQELTEHPDIDFMISSIAHGNLSDLAASMKNVLETVTIPAHPVIQTIKDRMCELGALNAMMSGSGPTVFGLFPDKEQGQQAYETCKKEFTDYQVEFTSFINRPQD